MSIREGKLIVAKTAVYRACRGKDINTRSVIELATFSWHVELRVNS